MRGAELWNTPAFQQWVKATQALPAERQIEAVSKKLMELNPGFDGKLTGGSGNGAPKIVKGVVRELEFFTNNVTDISPVRALKGLKALNCNGRSGLNGKLSDLSPLQGMPLARLECFTTDVSDLSPLRGMPLTTLYCWNTKISDLSPLIGMPLTILSVRDTQVSDVSPLRGMNLTDLWITPKNITKGMDVIRRMENLQVIAIGRKDDDKFPPAEFWKKYDAGEFGKPADPAPQPSPTRGEGAKKLAYLEPAFEEWVKDTQALSAEQQIEAVSKKLMELNPGFDGKVTSGNGKGPPKIEKGVVTEIGFSTDKVTDISPVRALLGLKFLRCNGSTYVAGELFDLSPLRGMALTSLNCNHTKVPDLSPLAGMPLTYLDCIVTKVSDLSPLRGMPLATLWFSSTQVSDLSPLKAMPLRNLSIHTGPVSDLSPLEGCKDLQLLKASKTKVTPTTVAALQKALPNCKIEWDGPTKPLLPPEDGGRRPDEGAKPAHPAPQPSPTRGEGVSPWNTPAFQQWAKETQTLPAEKQIEAVSKKLVELNPGFDGKLTGADGKGRPQISGGVVVGLAIVADNVTDISPVRALAGLKTLGCSGSPAGKRMLSDLSPLAGMKLTRLDCGFNQVADLSPLRGMPLRALTCPATLISDLSPLTGLPLKELSCNGCRQVSDLSPLKGLQLTSLGLQSTAVSDLSPLAGMPLTHFHCGGTTVADLAPLRGMRLASLYCYGTPIADLTPLQGMPLTYLDCSGTMVSDLSPLQGTNFTEIAFTPKNISKGLDTIRQMQSLKSIATSSLGSYTKFPPDEFWKKYDAGEFGKASPSPQPSPIKGEGAEAWNTPAFQAWVKATQALPAEKQIEAVSKKLIELNPGFDGKVTPKIVKGVVTELIFFSDKVTDISPVRALARLRFLSCAASPGRRSDLSDLSPLEGLALQEFQCAGAAVSDLSPLAGMPLGALHCSYTNVSDLAPLRGMALHLLDCCAAKISDLAPLRGMPLKDFHCQHTAVADLSPLNGAPLEQLYCQDAPITDLSPLAGMKLTRIRLSPERIQKGVDALRAMASVQVFEVPDAGDAKLSPAEFWKKYDAGEFGKPAAAAPQPSASRGEGAKPEKTPEPAASGAK